MRNPRLLVIVFLIALAAVWLYVVAPRPAHQPPAPPAAAPPPPPVEPPKQEPPAAPAAVTPPVEPAAPPAAKEPELEPPAAAPETTAEAPPEDTETAPEDETPPVPPADADHATDLMADLLAGQELEPEEGETPNATRDLWRRFDGEEADENWAASMEARLQETLQAWINAVPEDQRAHLVLVHVECRATLCQVLAADNDLAGQGTRAESGQEWQQGIASLQNQPWWAESFTDATTLVTVSDGYTLYVTYLMRRPPPEQG